MNGPVQLWKKLGFEIIGEIPEPLIIRKIGWLMPILCTGNYKRKKASIYS
jgi:hypothetical protein